MLKISLFIDSLNRKVGLGISWLAFVLVLLIVVDVVLRYLINYGSVANAELEWHLFGIIITGSVGYAYLENKHVRVDIFYNRFPDRTQAFVDLLGNCLLLLPFCIVGLYKSLPFALNSFEIRETSPDPGGLPARFLIKSMIPIAFFLLGLQTCSQIIKGVHNLTHRA